MATTDYYFNCVDEFDVYFRRAAVTSSDNTTSAPDNRHQQQLSRRDSAPSDRQHLDPSDLTGSGNRRSSSTHHSRTASCKYPHRRTTVPTVRHSSSVSPSKDKLVPSGSCSSAKDNPTTTTMVITFHQPDDDDTCCSGSGLPGNDPTTHSSSMLSALRASSPTGYMDSNGDRSIGRSRSAPHSRSSSWKKIRRDTSGCVTGGGGGKGRTAAVAGGPCVERRESVSFEEAISAKLLELKLLQADNCYVVRQFDTSPKGALVNRGDSIKRRHHRSGSGRSSRGNSWKGGNLTRPRPNSEYGMRPAASCTFVRDDRECGGGGGGCSSNLRLGDRPTPVGRQQQQRQQPWLDGSAGGGDGGGKPVKVLVMGEEGVGKTAILQQFMTSEYMAAVQTNFDYECEKVVSVLLNNEETILDFVEMNDSVYEIEQFGDVEAFVLVYSITAQQSFHYVISALGDIQQYYSSTPTIVVANKTDLVRTRQVYDEAVREVCKRCPFYQVSAALNHRVDELLVGIVSAVRASATGSYVGSHRAERSSGSSLIGCGGGGSHSRSGSRSPKVGRRELRSPSPTPDCTTELLSPTAAALADHRQRNRRHQSTESRRNCVRNAAMFLKGLFTKQKPAALVDAKTVSGGANSSSLK